MSDATLPASVPPVAAPSLARWVVSGSVLAAVLIFILREQLPALSSYPSELVIPFKEWIATAMTWLKVTFFAAEGSSLWQHDTGFVPAPSLLLRRRRPPGI